MKTILAMLALTLAGGAWAQATPAVPAKPAAKAVVLCDSCGRVTQLKQEKRKGEGGAVGIVGGAVVGGLLGNQIGKGNGNTVATVGGAVAGGFVGNEVQKKVTSRKVWVTTVKMKDGAVRSFEQEAQPGWAVGSTVRVTDQNALVLH